MSIFDSIFLVLTIPFQVINFVVTSVLSVLIFDILNFSAAATIM